VLFLAALTMRRNIGGLVIGLLFGALIARVAPDRDPARRIAVILFVVAIILGSGA
jgi:hypothetical protein